MTDHEQMRDAVRRFAARVRTFCEAIAEDPDSFNAAETYPAVIAQEGAYLASEGPAAYIRYVDALDAATARAAQQGDPSRLEPGELVCEYLQNWGPASDGEDSDAFPWTEADAPLFLQFLDAINPHTRIRWDTVRAEMGVTDEQLLGLAVAEAMVSWQADA